MIVEQCSTTIRSGYLAIGSAILSLAGYRTDTCEKRERHGQLSPRREAAPAKTAQDKPPHERRNGA